MTAARHDFQMDRGATFRRVLLLKQSADGPAMDLSNWSGEAKMRHTYEDASAAAEFDITINPSQGKVTMTLEANQTGSLEPGRYVYDLELDDGNGTVLRLIEGVIVVRPEATR